MRFLESLSANPLVEIVGRFLLHSLWQDAIIGILLCAALALLRKSTANVRYVVAYIGLVVMLVLPLGTALWGGTAATRLRPEHISTLASTNAPPLVQSSLQLAGSATNKNISPWQNTIDRNLNAAIPWIILIWIIGVAVSSVRLYRGWNQARQLMLVDQPLIPHEWQHTLERLMQQLRVTRPVFLLESSLVRVPTAVGWLRPMILLPVSTLAGLTPQQLETILIHELAHIRRNDYLFNLLQALIETLLFHHPAVWWLSSRIRTERELCCDDLTVSITGAASVYARALTEMEKIRRATPRLAVAANGGSLTKRIQRLVMAEPLPTISLWRVPLIVITIIASIIATSLASHFYTSIASAPPVSVEITDSSRATEHAAQEGAAVELSKLAGDLSSANPQKRAQAICSLAKSNDVAAIPVLVRALGDDAPLSGPVGCWDSGSWTPALSKFKQSSPGEEAVMALASFGEAAVDPLATALQDTNPSVRRNAAWAVGEIRGGLQVNRANTILGLYAALNDDDPWVRRAAAFSLGEVRDKRAAAALIGRLGDNSPLVREMAARSLGEMKAADAFRALTVTVTDHDRNVVAAAKWALSEILDE